MSSKNALGKEGTETVLATEQSALDAWTAAESERAWGAETPELQATYAQERAARVDVTYEERRGLTLEAEERLAAREWEIERTRTRYDREQHSDREARTSKSVATGSIAKRADFQARAACVNERLDKTKADPRERVSKSKLGVINQQAARIHGEFRKSSRAALSRELAEHVVAGKDGLSSAVAVMEAERTRRGTVVPISAVGDVNSSEVSIEGRVQTLWEPSSSKIQQVGLVEDESGVVKVTVWKRAKQPLFAEGDVVRIHAAAKSWYEGRCSLALTGWSRVTFPERGRWWSSE
ncbi:SOSS complex subunit B family protein [Haloarchaeobius sp. HME9146]|uniref:SOSS complex subunit B family protein n=1 Tax=Haloarchaeobius sp. HME9146 TaxID=2978732 RepID=UPI0021C1D670|nr:SOSS complex subunit B family protein [Haloarchaeobius sp. HME9146]MCT9098169.1 SOSS complex subunit B family protein [Haloarchaeobius sp. HME9146]